MHIALQSVSNALPQNKTRNNGARAKAEMRPPSEYHKSSQNLKDSEFHYRFLSGLDTAADAMADCACTQIETIGGGEYLARHDVAQDGWSSGCMWGNARSHTQHLRKKFHESTRSPVSGRVYIPIISLSEYPRTSRFVKILRPC